jgi:ribonuclease PH
MCHEYYFKTLISIAISVIHHGASLADAAMLAGSLALLNAGVQMGDLVVSCTVGLDEGRFVQFLKSEVSVHRHPSVRERDRRARSPRQCRT